MAQEKRMVGLQISAAGQIYLRNGDSHEQLQLTLNTFEQHIQIFKSNISYLGQNKCFSDLVHPMFLLDIYKIVYYHADPIIQYLQENIRLRLT